MLCHRLEMVGEDGEVLCHRLELVGEGGVGVVS